MHGNRSGSCAPTREDATPDDALAASTEPAASSKPSKAKATKTAKLRAPKKKSE